MAAKIMNFSYIASGISSASLAECAFHIFFVAMFRLSTLEFFQEFINANDANFGEGNSS